MPVDDGDQAGIDFHGRVALDRSGRRRPERAPAFEQVGMLEEPRSCERLASPLMKSAGALAEPQEMAHPDEQGNRLDVGRGASERRRR